MQELTFDDRQEIEKAPLPFKIFKGITGKFGAMRLTFKRPWQNYEGKKQEGVLFLEMAPPIGNNVYDWVNQKIFFALGLTDISELLYFFKSPNKFEDKNNDQQYKVSIYHDKGAGTKNKGKCIKILNITWSKDPKRTDFFINLTQKEYGKETTANMPLKPQEALIFMTLLEAAPRIILSWEAIGPDEQLWEKVCNIEEDINRLGKLVSTTLKELKK